MPIAGDRVPMFKLRPYRGPLIAASLIGIVGGLLSAYFFIEDAYLPRNRGLITLIVTGILVIALVISAYSRYVFRHLHHRRPGYKRG